ncbi:MAG TPA: Clp protease N-terminal domain-containing protein, partial [Mycobacteriales bacterium]|nr:Clp protease N-terminal domain-containing protein [Mycobacteriales bacterium]
MDYKLTTRSQEALAAAVRAAGNAGNPAVEPVHVLLALLDQADGTARPLLEAVGAPLDTVQSKAQALAGRLPSASGSTVASPNLSRQSAAVINAASDEARSLGDDYISTEHLLVGLAKEGGETAALLREVGATADALLGAFTQVRGHQRVTTPDPESTY